MHDVAHNELKNRLVLNFLKSLTLKFKKFYSKISNMPYIFNNFKFKWIKFILSKI